MKLIMKFSQLKKISFVGILILSSQIQAQYIFNAGLESNHGGSLPPNSIQFTGKVADIWTPTSATYTEWTNSSTYTCKTWTPSTDTVNKGETFTQTSKDCDVTQSRTKQEREINQKNEYRNSGVSVTETQTLNNQTTTRSAVGTIYAPTTITFGAGKTIISGIYIAGIYARNGTTDVGAKVYTPDGDRMVAYLYRADTTCQLRYGAGVSTGFTTGATPSTNAVNYIIQNEYATLYDKSGAVVNKYKSAGVLVAGTEGVYLKYVTIPCTVVNNFYNDITFYSKMVISVN